MQVVTGSWSKKAAEEAGKYCKVNIAAKGDNKSVPDRSIWKLTPGARYLHYCDNETIQGLPSLPLFPHHMWHLFGMAISRASTPQLKRTPGTERQEARLHRTGFVLA